MAGGPRPHQPRFARAEDRRGSEDAASRGRAADAGPAAGGSAAAEHRAGEHRSGGRADDARGPDGTGAADATGPPGGRTGSTRVRVNSQGKVAALDEQRESEFEPVPTGGGRFSDWRRTLQLGSARSGSRGSARKGPEDDRDRPRMSPALRRALIAAVALLLVLVLLWAVFFSRIFAVRTIDVEGVSLSDQEAVAESLQPLEGVPMTRISDDDVRELLEGHPAISGAQTSAGGSGTLHVAVQERIPVAAVEADGGWSLVDRDGVQVRSVEDRGSVQVPVIDGGTGVLGTDDWDTVSAVLATLPASLLEQVQTARAESGGIVMLELEDGVTVRWGDDTESGLKAEVLAALVDSPAATGEVGVYDVSAPRHPVLE